MVGFNKSGVIEDNKGDDKIIINPMGNVTPDKDIIMQDLGLMESSFNKEHEVTELKNEIEDEKKSSAAALFNSDDIDLKTELTQKEILSISKLMFIKERYDIPHIDVFINKLLRLKISKERKGRNEFIQGLHAEERKQQGGDLTPIGNFLGKLGM